MNEKSNSGFELLYATIASTLKSKNDLIVAVVHYSCIRNDFLCVGIGENFSESDAGLGSALMPTNWNASQDTYVLRYLNEKTKQKLLVKCVKVSDILLISALIINGESNGWTHSLTTDEHINDEFRTFKSAFSAKSVDNISQIIDREVIRKVLTQTNSESAPKTNITDNQRSQDRDRQHDPLRIGRPHLPNYGGQAVDPFYAGQWPPPIGGADLDPLGRAQGGMLMDPRNFPGVLGRGPNNPVPGLPRGAVPPGARFDPFGPPGVGPNIRPNRNPPRGFGVPDPDHFPPPGYEDMFM